MGKASAIRQAARVALGALWLGACGIAAAAAQDAEAFYKSHALTLGVPNGPGGTYDSYMRVLARHLPSHIPGNPSILVQNVPAAGGMALANMIYSTAPKDGSYIGMVRGTVLQEQIYKDRQVQFDGLKFAWLGNMNTDYDSCVVWAASGITSIDDFYTREIIVGASGAGAQSYSFPRVYDELLGMKLKIIVGYPDTPERLLAMERGELTGACGISTSSLSSTLAGAVKNGKVRVIAQGGEHKDPRYPTVPNILDQAKTPDVRRALEFIYATLSLGRPIAAPPGTPEDRLAVLRKGLTETLKDPEFLQDAKKVGVDIEFANAEATRKLVEGMFATPASIVARVQAAMAP